MNQVTKVATPTALTERDLTNEQWDVLRNAIWPGAETKESILMAIDYCRARHLDPFKRPVHIVPMWSRRHGKMIETVWPGISEIRTTAARTGEYVGCSAPEWGPIVEREFERTEKRKGSPDVQLKEAILYPAWCRITVKRRHPSGMVADYTAEVYWEEAYARESRFSDTPNEMWRKRARGQLAKCTEAAALRIAFPEEVGNELTAEEMEGQLIDISQGTPVTEKTALEAPPAPVKPNTAAPKAKNAAPPQTLDAEAEPPAEDPIEDSATGDPFDAERLKDTIGDRLAECQCREDVDAVWRDFKDDIASKVFPPDRPAVEALFSEALEQFA